MREIKCSRHGMGAEMGMILTNYKLLIKFHKMLGALDSFTQLILPQFRSGGSLIVLRD